MHLVYPEHLPCKLLHLSKYGSLFLFSSYFGGVMPNSGIVTVSDHAEGNTEADDCYGSCSCGQGGETYGRYARFTLDAKTFFIVFTGW